MHDVHRDSLISKGNKRKVKKADHDYSPDEHALGGDHGHGHDEKNHGVQSHDAHSHDHDHAVIRTMTVPPLMATATAMKRMPTRSMITIFIPTAMGMIANVLKTVPLPICMNTVMTFFMHTITRTILNMQV